MSTPKLSSLEDPDLEVANAHRGEAGPSKEAQTQSSTRKEGAFEQKIYDLQLNLQAAVDQRNDLDLEITSLYKAYREEVGEKEAYKQRVSELEKKVASLRWQRDTGAQEIKEVQASLNLAVADLRKAQLCTFKKAQTGWFVEEDSKVRQALGQLYKDLRSWAKKYSITSFNDIPDLPDQAWKILFKEISKVASFSSRDSLFSFKHPFLILAGLLSDYINVTIFQNMFYIFYTLDAAPDDLKIKVVEDLFKRLSQSDLSEANIWRAQLFRIIFNAPESHELHVGNGFSTKQLSRLLHFFSKDFEHSAVSELLREMGEEEEDQCRVELLAIFRAAAKVHSRLLTQRTWFQWQPLSELLSQAFDIRSPFLAADRLHKLDDEDESCDGKKVKIVVSPAVWVFGDSNGENLQSSRTILKAMVFLED